MRKIKMYGHGGSLNHGCEAIVRSTAQLLKDDAEVTVFSNKPYEDVKFGLDKICRVLPSQNTFDPQVRSLKSMTYHFYTDLLKDSRKSFLYYNRPFFKHVNCGDLLLCGGGDLYCYNSWRSVKLLNDRLLEKGAKIVLWGCSVEPETLLQNREMQQDIQRYSLITAREQLSYNVLKKINPNTLLCCDTAFILKPQETALPAGFLPGATVGINMSPLVQQLEGEKGMVFENYCGLIEWILNSTRENIALIPHVTWSDVNDMQPLERLYRKFRDTDRLVLVSENLNCAQLKYIISHCSCFVGARTHATIAAYSSYVPTLVCGYSVKARGIALDLFETEQNFVVSAQKMKERASLSAAFKNIYESRITVREKLKSQIPQYTDSLNKVKQTLLSL